MTTSKAITAMPVRTRLGKKRPLIGTWSLQPEIMTLPFRPQGNGYPIRDDYPPFVAHM
jgi:hypothetical protein